MQPYLFPYIGYYQLIGAVDLFIVYDNIKYTKKGWINRNRILQNGKAVTFSVPLKKDSDFLDVRDRRLSTDFNRQKLLNRLRGAYERAPCFAQTFPLVEEVLQQEQENLFEFLRRSIDCVCAKLGITTQIKVSSDIAVDHGLKSQERVLAICAALGADTYVNAIGGRALYCAKAFEERGVTLKFIQSKPFQYDQFGGEFIPALSIIDVMMFNSVDAIRNTIETGYELI